MIIKGIIDEVFQDYKEISMLIEMPHCSFKCLTELNLPISICQNCDMAKQNNIEIANEEIIQRYLANDLTKAIIFAGLEPMDSLAEVLDFIRAFRQCSQDYIIIYTGFKKTELNKEIALLQEFPNIIMKFGRFLPDRIKRYDTTLGVYLASPNQYARKIS